ncbi:MAG TPA: M15 family metallopeptidase, partial [Bacillota bacterium]|nr:M15 family metallopeptidase [Bacillota bacterium]
EAELKATRKKRDLLEKELTKYNELDTTIDTLSGEIEKLQQTIDLLEAGIDPEVDNPDPKVVQKKLQAKKQALKNATNKLTQKTKERDSDLLRRFAKSGFLTLPKILVEAMKTAGFTWGGDWSPDKDFMHFDLR